ncbi:unnamed protein product [Triticum turgidum subsp. durum]|uniref:Uncharacterized protein n=1 Tax=Triticum turgidum subsp. durum TaxID=4567 RepID=A0A9R0TXS4_TRITD|nr:unnamed protein product [Triticum turgidum subsp. durum]
MSAGAATGLVRIAEASDCVPLRSGPGGHLPPRSLCLAGVLVGAGSASSSWTKRQAFPLRDRAYRESIARYSWMVRASKQPYLFSKCLTPVRLVMLSMLLKIDEEEIEACPVCDVALGITPEEKLRADISIQAIRNYLFPPKADVDAFEAPTITLPAKRKERSISSLVETPKMSTQSTLTGRRTKAARRTITSQTFSLGKLPNKSEDRYQMAEKASALKSTKMTTSANKKQNSVDISEDGKNHGTIDKEELEKPLRSLVVASAKKSQNPSPCLKESHKNKTTTEHTPRESPEADSHDGITTQVWFSLVTSPNQIEAKLLPQLEKNFYRIKDGTMRVSSILRLIMKKLELASDDKVGLLDVIVLPFFIAATPQTLLKSVPCYQEIVKGPLSPWISIKRNHPAAFVDLDGDIVEILCHDESVCPSTTLHGLLERWLSCKPKEEVLRPWFWLVTVYARAWPAKLHIERAEQLPPQTSETVQ